MDNVKNGQRISCNGVNGTVIGRRSIRNRRIVLVKMDNGFTLKFNANTLSASRAFIFSDTSPNRISRNHLL
jgi:hypothetical protein